MSKSRGRWSKYKRLKENSTLSEYLLETKFFTQKSLNEFLQDYKYIMIKPCIAEGTMYVFRSEGNREFEIRVNNESIKVNNEEDVYNQLKKRFEKNRKYIIQPVLDRGDLHSKHFITIHKNLNSPGWRISSILNEHGNHKKNSFVNDICLLIGEQLETIAPECKVIVIEVGYDSIGNIKIIDTLFHFPLSKWSKYHTMISIESLSSYIPETQLVTANTLHQFLRSYKEVILKPCVGKLGNGVVQVSLRKKDLYEIHYNKKELAFNTIKETFTFLQEKFLSKKQYLVQPRISLACIDGNLFDIRVILQRSFSTPEWKVTGELIKVASNGFIVTNVAKSILTIDEGLNKSTINRSINKIKKEIYKVCMISGNRLSDVYQSLNILGYDIGVNHDGEVFIIEVNFKPAISMFSLLGNKEMYENIKKIRKENKHA